MEIQGLYGTDSILLETLNNPHSSLRDVYDAFIDYLSQNECFLSFGDRPCMFESYGTIIQFHRVAEATEIVDKSHIGRIAASLRETMFTPLAGVLASFIEWKP